MAQQRAAVTRRRTAGEATKRGLAATTMPPRVSAIDNLRGLAIIAMVAFHFSFDLRHFGFTAADFYRDPFWLHARTAILSSFLFLAGVSLVLAQSTTYGRARFWRQVVRVAGAAMLVSAASFIVFPQRYIWFGVLHAIAVSLLLLRPLAHRPWLALGLGVAMIVAGNTWTSPWFDGRAWGWVGFMTAKPPTEDYVPLFPWTGVMLVGMAAAYGLRRGDFRALTACARLPAPLGTLGRHSLAIYLVHQPVLFGVVYLAATVMRPMHL